MEVHLVDGTYELFRHYYAVPGSKGKDGQEIGAVRGVLNSLVSMLDKGATHVGFATDKVIESFRNDLYQFYKTGEGIDPDLFSQFPIVENAAESMGIHVWPMVEFEADDALAATAAKCAELSEIERIYICTPDKDLAQCVSGERVVQLDRRREIIRDEKGVIEKFGVSPDSIPDYLALVGDTADGYPGLAGWGAKAASAVLSHYKKLENIPAACADWPKSIRGASKLSATLKEFWNDALLYRTLATLRLDVPVFDSVDQLLWRGPKDSFKETCERLKAPELFKKTTALAEKRKT
ncbi:MAG TPA: 5'-3' exonuclease H3TH domain-containing protein [Oculatellaceae cyanobacterium]